MNQPFWKTKKLDEMTQDEWESVCDGCGKCCLVKLEFEDSSELEYTNMACEFLDEKSCRCTVYNDRQEKVASCVTLKADILSQLQYMPDCGLTKRHPFDIMELIF